MADSENTENAAAETNPSQVNHETPPVEMKCVSLTGFGGIKMVKVVNKPEKKPEKGEVLIRIKACGMSFLDLMVRQGVIDNPPKTPVTMGFECSGEIEALGEEVSDFMVGERVICFREYEAWAESVCAPTQHVYKMPTNMSFEEGAAFAVNYLTAYFLLFEIGNLRSGQSVFTHSTGGGVGIAITQLCKTIDDVTLFGTASAHKHETIKENVSHLFDHNVDYCQEVKKISPEGLDLVLDCLCGDDTNKGISLLKPMGRYVLYGSSNIVTGETKSFFSFAKSWWQVDKISPIKLYDENKSISGFTLRHLIFKQGQHKLIRDVMDKLFQLYNQGKLKPTIDSTWALEDVAEAMQKMHDRKNIGKVILDPAMTPIPKKEASSVSSTERESAKEQQQNGEQ